MVLNVWICVVECLNLFKVGFGCLGIVRNYGMKFIRACMDSIAETYEMHRKANSVQGDYGSDGLIVLYVLELI